MQEQPNEHTQPIYTCKIDFREPKNPVYIGLPESVRYHPVLGEMARGRLDAETAYPSNKTVRDLLTDALRTEPNAWSIQLANQTPYYFREIFPANYLGEKPLLTGTAETTYKTLSNKLGNFIQGIGYRYTSGLDVIINSYMSAMNICGKKDLPTSPATKYQTKTLLIQQDGGGFHYDSTSTLNITFGALPPYEGTIHELLESKKVSGISEQRVVLVECTDAALFTLISAIEINQNPNICTTFSSIYNYLSSVLQQPTQENSWESSIAIANYSKIFEPNQSPLTLAYIFLDLHIGILTLNSNQNAVHYLSSTQTQSPHAATSLYREIKTIRQYLHEKFFDTNTTEEERWQILSIFEELTGKLCAIKQANFQNSYYDKYQLLQSIWQQPIFANLFSKLDGHLNNAIAELKLQLAAKFTTEDPTHPNKLCKKLCEQLDTLQHKMQKDKLLLCTPLIDTLLFEITQTIDKIPPTQLIIFANADRAFLDEIFGKIYNIVAGYIEHQLPEPVIAPTAAPTETATNASADIPPAQAPDTSHLADNTFYSWRS